MTDIRIPDIGDFKDVPIIEIFVKPGDSVKVDDPLVALESDKATMEVPSPQPGTVKEISVETGDKVSEGTLILVLEGMSAPAVPPKTTVSGAGAPSPEWPAGYRSSTPNNVTND